MEVMRMASRTAVFLAATMIVAGYCGNASAGDSFKTLSGITAEHTQQLSAAEMDGVKGKFFADPWGNLYDLFGGVYLATATPGQFQGMNNVVYNYDGTNLWDQNNQFWFNMYLNVGLADGRLFSLAANRQLGRWY
jgi:hypothetical protein